MSTLAPCVTTSNTLKIPCQTSAKFLKTQSLTLYAPQNAKSRHNTVVESVIGARQIRTIFTCA